MIPILAVLCASGLCACRGDDRQAQPAVSPSNVPASTFDSGPSATKPSRETGLSVEDLRLMPENSAFVFGADLAQLKTTALWAELVEPELRRPELRDGLKHFETVCGFDPIAAIASILQNDGYWKDVHEAVTIMRLADGVTTASLSTCLKKLSASSSDAELVAHTEDLYTFRTAANWYALKFLDDATIVVVAGPRVTSNRIHELLADSGLRWSGAFSGLLHSLDVRAPAWALLDLQSSAAQKLGSLGTGARAVYAKLSLADGMRFEVRVRMPSSAAAVKAAKASPGQRARTLDALEMTSEGQDLLITAAPSRPQVAALVSQLRAFVAKSDHE
jgi:hypothetical protein